MNTTMLGRYDVITLLSFVHFIAAQYPHTYECLAEEYSKKDHKEHIDRMLEL